jgi:hypothetical protein
LDFQNSNDLHDIWGTMQRYNWQLVTC